MPKNGFDQQLCKTEKLIPFHSRSEVIELIGQNENGDTVVENEMKMHYGSFPASTSNHCGADVSLKFSDIF